ncbi:hypothetical protein HDU67_000719, partial [Dinochytrium kinnereticum]
MRVVEVEGTPGDVVATCREGCRGFTHFGGMVAVEAAGVVCACFNEGLMTMEVGEGVLMSDYGVATGVGSTVSSVEEMDSSSSSTSFTVVPTLTVADLPVPSSSTSLLTLTVVASTLFSSLSPSVAPYSLPASPSPSLPSSLSSDSPSPSSTPSPLASRESQGSPSPSSSTTPSPTTPPSQPPPPAPIPTSSRPITALSPPSPVPEDDDDDEQEEEEEEEEDFEDDFDEDVEEEDGELDRRDVLERRHHVGEVDISSGCLPCDGFGACGVMGDRGALSVYLIPVGSVAILSQSSIASVTSSPSFSQESPASTISNPSPSPPLQTSHPPPHDPTTSQPPQSGTFHLITAFNDTATNHPELINDDHTGIFVGITVAAMAGVLGFLIAVHAFWRSRHRREPLDGGDEGERRMRWWNGRVAWLGLRRWGFERFGEGDEEDEERGFWVVRKLPDGSVERVRPPSIRRVSLLEGVGGVERAVVSTRLAVPPQQMPQQTYVSQLFSFRMPRVEGVALPVGSERSWGSRDSTAVSGGGSVAGRSFTGSSSGGGGVGGRSFTGSSSGGGGVGGRSFTGSSSGSVAGRSFAGSSSGGGGVEGRSFTGSSSGERSKGAGET